MRIVIVRNATKKRRKEDLGDEKTVSTEELKSYDSQEKVSEEGNQEIAETEIKNLLTFDELQQRRR